MVLLGAPAERFAAWLGTQLPGALATATYFLLTYIGALLALYLSYRVLHLAMRLRPLGAALSYASFNQYWRRYLAPGIKVKDLRGRRP